MQINEGLLLATLLVCLNFLFSRMKDFSCSTQALLGDNLLAKHAFNVLAIFFMLVLFTRSTPLQPSFLILAVMIMYAFFLMITKCDSRFLVAFLVCMTIVFYIEADKNWRFRSPDKDPAPETPARQGHGLQGHGQGPSSGSGSGSSQGQVTKRDFILLQFCIELVSFVVVGVGVLVYMGQHSREFVNDWSWSSFWLGVNKCTGDGIPIKKSVWGDLVDGLRRACNLPPLPGGVKVKVKVKVNPKP
jgi:hypothetical protein